MTIDEKILDGKQLISCDYIAFGDYDNSCAVERANVRWLEKEGLIELLERGSYGYEKAWIADNEENRELLEALNNYPCFDDGLVSEIEAEIESEYLKDYARDLHDLLPDSVQKALEELDIDEIDYTCYRAACEEMNEYFIVESGGNGWIDFKKIAGAYNEALLEKHPAVKTLSRLYDSLDVVVKFPVDFYENMRDMKQHRESRFDGYTEEEVQQIVNYCCKLEELVGGVTDLTPNN